MKISNTISLAKVRSVGRSDPPHHDQHKISNLHQSSRAVIMKRYLSLFLLLVLLWGCSPQFTSMPASPTLTLTPSPIPPSATFTPSPLPHTATSLPTAKPTSPSTCGPYQAVDVKIGTYDCAQYTAAEGIFSCDLSQIQSHIPVSAGYELVRDVKLADPWNGLPLDPENGGGLHAHNFGFEVFVVNYINRSRLPDEIKSLLETSDTRKQGLESIFEDVQLAPLKEIYPEAEMIHKDFLDDGLLLAEFIFKMSESDIYQEAMYLSIAKDFLYFIVYMPPVIYTFFPDFEERFLTSAELKSYLDELYAACEFHR